MNKPHKTARARKTLSAPAQFLQQQGLLKGRVLDYGCGRGFDADTLGIHGYDPHWRPKLPRGQFDTVLCTFVLNVLPTVEERQKVLESIEALMRHNTRRGCKARAYITVRADVAELKGWTAQETWQGLIKLNFPVVHQCKGWVMYLMACQCREIWVGGVRYFGGIDECPLHGFGITEAECEPLTGWEKE